MLSLLIRYTTIVLCGNRLYLKLLYIKNKPSFFIPFNIFTIPFVTLFSYLLSANLQYLILPIIILITFIYFVLTTPSKPETIFTCTVISYGICYSFFYLSVAIVYIVICIPLYILFNKTIHYIYSQILIAVIQSVLCILIFRIKRLKKGMPFLKNHLFSKIGVLISSAILFCSMFISSLSIETSNFITKYYLIPIPFIFTLAIFIFMWWRNQIQQSYLLQLKDRDNKRLEEQLELYKEKLSTLEQENQEMSSLIHRDNKLIPSMQLAVQRFMELSMLETDTEKIMQKGSSLLTQLEQEMLDRNGVVTKLSQPEQRLPSSGTDSIDQLLNYMQQRCLKENITLEVSFSDHITEMVQDVIKEKDCVTILADLLENAMIAVKAMQGKHILLQIGKMDSIYKICIWDDGIPFHKSVLYNLGKKRHTTRKEEGGSGIGLMNTYALLQSYHATLQINEQTDDHPFYRKAIAILFNGKQEYRLVPNRPEKDIIYLKQRKELIIEETKRHH